MENKIITAIVIITLIATIGMTAISMNRNAFAQSEQFSPDNGLCAVDHTCTCTNGVFHDLTTGFSINNGCTSNKG